MCSVGTVHDLRFGVYRGSGTTDRRNSRIPSVLHLVERSSDRDLCRKESLYLKRVDCKNRRIKIMSEPIALIVILCLLIAMFIYFEVIEDRKVRK